MRAKIKKARQRAGFYAGYVVVGLAVLLFLSVFRASIFDRYLFTLEDLPGDAGSQGRFLERLREIDPGLAASVEGVRFVPVTGRNAVDLVRGDETIATLEAEGETLYVEAFMHRTRIGYVREEGGKTSIYASITPESEKIWFELSFILLAAITAEFLVIYVKQPAVMVLLLLGIAISPSAIGIIYPPLSGALSNFFSAIGLSMPLQEYIPHLVPTEEGSFVSIFAKLGSIFLLFEVGLHAEISKIFNRRNFIVALAGIIFPFIAGYAYASFMGHGFAYSMFLAAALTATSVGVTVAVLQEFGVLDKEFAKIILGAAVIDDILGLLVLSLVKNLPENPSGFDAATLYPFMTVLLMALVFVAGGIKLGSYIVKRFFDKEPAGGRIPKASFLGILVYVLAYSYVAEIIGLSAIVGAFLAGVTLNYSRLIHRIVELFYPLEAFFTPIFFISLGMFVDIKALFVSLEPILVITALAVIAKIAACGLTTRITGAGIKDSLIVGIGMVPRGEVALIIGFYGLSATTTSGEPILSSSEYAVIASMAFLTTVIIPPMLEKALEYGGYRTK